MANDGGNMKRIEAAHHKWQRKILGISWKDKITNAAGYATVRTENTRSYIESTTAMAGTLIPDGRQQTAKAGIGLVSSNQEEKRASAEAMEGYSNQ